MKINFQKKQFALITIFTIQVIGALFGFLLQLAIARYIDVHEYGMFSISLNLIVIFSIVINFGSANSVLRYVSITQSNPLQSTLLLKSYIYFNLCNWLLLSIVFFLCALYFSDSFDSTLTFPMLLSFLLWGLFQALVNLLQSFDRAIGNPIRGLILSSLLKPICIGGCLFYYYWQYSKLTPIGLIASYTISISIISILFLYFSKKYLTYKQFYRGYYKSLQKSSQYFVNTGLQTLLKNLDLIIIGFVLTSYEAGIYAVATRINTIIVFGLSSLNILYSPMVAKLYSEGKIKQLNASLSESNKLIFSFSLCIFVFITLYGDWVLSLFGSDYKVGYSTLILLMSMNIIESAFGITGSVLNMTGNQSYFNKILIVIIVIYLLFSTVIAEYFGLEGMATLAICIALIKNLAQWKLIYFKLGIHSGVVSEFFYWFGRKV